MKARSYPRTLAVALALSAVTTRGGDAAAAPTRVLRDPEAIAHFEHAQEHFGAENYADAIPELKAAYAIEPNPMLLYAWGQAERLSGNCTRAIELYRVYLDTGPADEQQRLTQTNLLDCEADLASASGSDSDPDDAYEDEPVPENPVPETVDRSSPRHWGADPLGGVLVGLGGAGVVSGGVLMGVARRRAARAPDASVENDYLAERAQARRLNIAGIAALSAGGALALGGVIRYVLVSRRDRSSRKASTARVTPLWTGVMLGIEGTF